VGRVGALGGGADDVVLREDAELVVDAVGAAVRRGAPQEPIAVGRRVGKVEVAVSDEALPIIAPELFEVV
jgi:hypothetical protein